MLINQINPVHLIDRIYGLYIACIVTGEIGIAVFVCLKFSHITTGYNWGSILGAFI